MFGLEKLGYKIEVPPPQISADLAIPAFKEDKEKILKEVVAANNLYVAEAKIIGGYVNIKLNIDKLTPEFLKTIRKEKDKYGFNKDGSKKKVLIEYSSPNIAKPLHIGHLRNTLLGIVLKNIYRANGYKVITENWIGDWGKQYGLVIIAYQRWGNEKEFKKNPTRHLFDLYVKASQMAKADPQLDQEARDTFRQLEDGNKKLLQLWKKFRAASIKDFKKTYKKLGAHFDIWNGESFYTKLMPEIVKEALEKKVAIQEPDGPILINLEPYGLRTFLLAKSDGASLYATRDLATAKYRLEKYGAEKVLYVVAHEQELHLKHIFKTMGLLGYPAHKLFRVNYGVVNMAGAKMSTRAGNVIFIDDLIGEAVKKSKGSEVIGLGALFYNILAQTNDRDISFSWEKALNLQGNSAPYIQYGYVRAVSVLKKARKKGALPKKLPEANLEERDLIKSLAFYPEVVRRACQLNEPHIIAEHLNHLVQQFNRFYEKHPIIKAERSAQEFRLALVGAVAQTIKNGLCLLEIKVPQKM